MTQPGLGRSTGTGARPVWTLITVEETGRGVHLTIPAVGCWRRQKAAPWAPAQSLLWVGAFLCVLVALMTAWFVFLALNTSGPKPVKDARVVAWPIWAGLGGFWVMALAARKE